MSKTVMLVLADSIQCSVHDKKLRGNEIFRYKEHDQNGFFMFFHHHPTNSTNLAWLKVDTPKNST